MQEFDLIRVMIYGCCMTISIVTFVKQLRIKGIFGTSNKLISFGIFSISSSLLFQTIFSILDYQDPIWNPIIQIFILFLFVIGIGLTFFALWKVTIFFDELRNTAVAGKQILPVKPDDESK